MVDGSLGMMHVDCENKGRCQLIFQQFIHKGQIYNAKRMETLYIPVVQMDLTKNRHRQRINCFLPKPINQHIPNQEFLRVKKKFTKTKQTRNLLELRNIKDFLTSQLLNYDIFIVRLRGGIKKKVAGFHFIFFSFSLFYGIWCIPILLCGRIVREDDEDWWGYLAWFYYFNLYMIIIYYSFPWFLAEM